MKEEKKEWNSTITSPSGKVSKWNGEDWNDIAKSSEEDGWWVWNRKSTSDKQEALIMKRKWCVDIDSKTENVRINFDDDWQSFPNLTREEAERILKLQAFQ